MFHILRTLPFLKNLHHPLGYKKYDVYVYHIYRLIDLSVDKFVRVRGAPLSLFEVQKVCLHPF